jgi:hypothetical protein
LWCLVAVGCAQVTSEPLQDAIRAAENAAADTTPTVARGAATPEPASAAPVAGDAVAPEPLPAADVPATTDDSTDAAHLANEPEPAASAVSPADVVPETSEPVVGPEASAARQFEPAPSLSPRLVATPTTAETLDFSSLVARLRKTKAINLRTKVAVKNESDDLLEQFRAYHTQTGETTLAELRHAYDSLFRELHSLLEDADPPLARDIDRSQAAIWELLADPTKFRASDLMAGA